MVEVVNWVLSGLVGVLVIIIGYVLKMLISKFDEMIKSINALNKTLALHTQRLNQGDKEIKTLSDNVNLLHKDLNDQTTVIRERLDKVEDRILEIEIVHKFETNHKE